MLPVPRRDGSLIDQVSLPYPRLSLAAEIQAKESMFMPGIYDVKSSSLDHSLHDPVHGRILVLDMIGHDTCKFISAPD